MNSPRKVLLIDNGPERKVRIKALREHGYRVFPALNLEEARSRCLRGGYDLIVVHDHGDRERTQNFCDEIRAQRPQQFLLMSSNTTGERDYAVGSDLASLMQRVDAMLQGSAKGADLASAA